MELDSAAEAIETCLAVGVTEFIVCGGARNLELVAILADLPPPARCWNYPEERSAAFFALGRARASGRPVAVVTTSGTAVAELLPAAIEAHYQAVPLLLLTADRPARFRRSGAPQAIEQQGLFGVYAEGDLERWGGDRPLHLNVRLEEPTAEGLIAGSGPIRREQIVLPPPKFETSRLTEFLARGQDGLLVMLGCLPAAWRAGVRDFLLRLGAPVYAEASSGLREDGALPGRAERGGRVLRIGGVPSCRAWRDLESQPEVPVFSVAPNALPGLARDSEVVRAVAWEAVVVPEALDVAPASEDDIEDLLASLPNSEPGWMRALSEAIPAGGLVFLGNSLPVREWNRCASYADRGLRCFANRGANGIDGTVSSFLGMAEGEAEAWLIAGDLTAIYDLAAPWALPQLAAGNRRLVVINNGGGKIFRRLPALTAAGDEAREIIENPHAIAFEHWAAMWEMGYRRAESPDDLRGLPDGAVVIEIVPDESQSELFWTQLGKS